MRSDPEFVERPSLQTAIKCQFRKTETKLQNLRFLGELVLRMMGHMD